jgi:hypothetical protein
MKSLCFFKKNKTDKTEFIDILKCAISVKTDSQHELSGDFISFFLDYDNYPYFFSYLNNVEYFDFEKIKTSVSSLSESKIEEYSMKRKISRLEDGKDISYGINLGILKCDFFIIVCGFLKIEEIIKQMIFLTKSSLYFVQIADVGNNIEGIYMSLANDDFGSIFFAEVTPEYAQPEQIHPIAKDFTEFMGMLALYEYKYSLHQNFKTSAKLIAWCKDDF